MCVIVTVVPGSMPEPEDILAMSDANPDGGGVSWWDGERLMVFENVDPLKVVGFIFSHWDSLKSAPCLIRFRIATNGAVSPENCHPFRTERGYIAHNGMAYDFEDGPYGNDSKNMVRAWGNSGYDDSVFAGQGLVALITPHGCLKWLEGKPIEYGHGVWGSNMYRDIRKVFGRVARHAMI